MEEDTPNIFHQCRICDVKFAEYTLLEFHCNLHLKHNPTVPTERDCGTTAVHQCRICSERFVEYVDLEKHCKSHVQGKTADDQATLLTQMAGSLNDTTSLHRQGDLRSRYEEGMSAVMSTHRFKCSPCKTISLRQNDLDDHARPCSDIIIIDGSDSDVPETYEPSIPGIVDGEDAYATTQINHEQPFKMDAPNGETDNKLWSYTREHQSQEYCNAIRKNVNNGGAVCTVYSKYHNNYKHVGEEETCQQIPVKETRVDFQDNVGRDLNKYDAEDNLNIYGNGDNNPNNSDIDDNDPYSYHGDDNLNIYDSRDNNLKANNPNTYDTEGNNLNIYDIEKDTYKNISDSDEKASCFSGNDNTDEILTRSDSKNNNYKNLAGDNRPWNDNQPYKCSICYKVLRTLGGLREHHRIHTGEKPFTCNICDKRFRVKCLLKVHTRIHTGEKPYECDICYRAFSQSGTLKVHKRTHSGEKPYECLMCNKYFRQRSALWNHMKQHSDEWSNNESGKIPYIRNKLPSQDKEIRYFETKSKRFIKNDNIIGNKLHIRPMSNEANVQTRSKVEINRKEIHDSTPPCSKSPTRDEVLYKRTMFDGKMSEHSDVSRIDDATRNTNNKMTLDALCSRRLLSELRIRRKIQPGDTPFSCSYCGRSYSTRCNLQTHITMHTGQRPFECHHCDKTFRIKQLLLIHIRKHTEEYPYKCDVCYKSFAQPSRLKTHTNTHNRRSLFESAYNDFPSLELHMESHNKEMPVVSNECTSLDQATVAQENTIFGSEKPFKCQICGGSFSQNEYLEIHLEIHS